MTSSTTWINNTCSCLRDYNSAKFSIQCPPAVGVAGPNLNTKWLMKTLISRFPPKSWTGSNWRKCTPNQNWPKCCTTWCREQSSSKSGTQAWEILERRTFWSLKIAKSKWWILPRSLLSEHQSKKYSRVSTTLPFSTLPLRKLSTSDPGLQSSLISPILKPKHGASAFAYLKLPLSIAPSKFTRCPPEK